jgi:type IV secretory pathway VirB4 component
MLWTFLRGFRTTPRGLEDVLPWATLLHKDIMLCKDESLLAIWRMEALDRAQLSMHEQAQLMTRLNGPWKRLEAGWGVWIDIVRQPAQLPRVTPLKHPLANLIEQDHRAHYDPQLWQDTTYLSLWHRRAHPVTETLKEFWSPTPEVPEAEVLDGFRDACAATLDVLRGGLHALKPLADDALCTYLHGIISDQWQEVRTPDFPTHMDYALSDCGWMPGWHPRLCRDDIEGVWVSMVSVKAFPAIAWTGMLDGMKRLPFGSRLVARWMPQNLDRMQRQLTKRQQRLTAKGYSLRGAAAEWLFQTQMTRMKNRYAEYAADDTDQANFELQKEDVGFGDLSVTVVLTDADAAVLQHQVRAVEQVFRSAGLVTVRRWLNSTGAWLATLPGLAFSDPRRVKVSVIPDPRRFKVSTMNALHVAWPSDPWRGNPETPVFHAPGLLLAKTEGCMPYWLGIDSEDVLHSLVSGPSGSGKSTFLKRVAAAFLRYDETGPPQLFWMDHKRSARLFILAMGGQYHELGRGVTNFQPLRDLETVVDRQEAANWLTARVKEFEPHVTSGQAKLINQAVDALARRPKSQRTLTEFIVATMEISTFLRKNWMPKSINPMTGARDNSDRDERLKEHSQVRDAIEPYTRGHLYGHVFDADHEDIGTCPIQGFDSTAFINTPELLVPAWSHIWRKLYRLFTGVPTLIPIEEAGEQFKYEEVLTWVDRGLRMLREMSVGMMLATQNHLDFRDSRIGPMLRTNCPRMFLLPNANATAEDTWPSYQALGLGRREVEEWIAPAIPKQDVYVVAPPHRRLIHLRMAPLAELICAPSSPHVHQRIDELLAMHGPEHFGATWLRDQGCPDLADVLDAQRSVA